MKTLLLTFAMFALVACGNTSQQSDAETNQEKTTTMTQDEIKTLSFDELFVAADVQALGNPFAISDDASVLTAGKADRYNSMIASWGGWGVLFRTPCIYHLLRSSRYTVELIREHNTYTVSIFPEEYNEQIMLFGSKSGRDSDKMKETTLTAVATPSGNMTYKEAAMVVECKLTKFAAVSPDDFVDEGYKDFVANVQAESGEYYNLVFSEITNVWVRK